MTDSSFKKGKMPVFRPRAETLHYFQQVCITLAFLTFRARLKQPPTKKPVDFRSSRKAKSTSLPSFYYRGFVIYAAHQ
jgi:hypothetical protein